MKPLMVRSFKEKVMYFDNELAHEAEAGVSSLGDILELQGTKGTDGIVPCFSIWSSTIPTC